MVRNIEVTIDNKKHKATIDTNRMVGECYWASLDDGRMFLMQDDFSICTPLTDKRLIDFFTANDNEDLCLVLKGNEDSLPLFYHYKKVLGKYCNVYSTNSSDKCFLRIVESDRDDYWLLEKINGDQALYYPRNARQVTPFFTEINFDIQDSIFHLAQYYKTINVDGGIKTSLIGYIGYNGEFTSRVYDVEADSFFFIPGFGVEEIAAFNSLVNNRINFYSELDESMNEKVDDVLDELFNEHIEIQRVKKDNGKGKIIDFKKRK